MGNLNGAAPFTSCDYTRTACVARGMFDTDTASHVTRDSAALNSCRRRFRCGALERAERIFSSLIDNQARYNDFVPLVYGTAWYKPPIVFARNDGNLTHMEVLLGMGEIEDVVKVVVNDVEIPEGAERHEHDGDRVVQSGDAWDAKWRVQSGFHGRVGASAGRSVRQHGAAQRGGAEPDEQRAIAADD